MAEVHAGREQTPTTPTGMAELAVDELTQWATELVIPKITERFGAIQARDAEVVGLAVAAALATVAANPQVVLRALKMERLRYGWGLTDDDHVLWADAETAARIKAENG